MILSSHCQCRDVRLILSLSNPIESYTPRACDCEFCTQRNIAYLSDSESQLKIISNNKLKSYQHGSNQAKFLACGNCDDVVAVTYCNDEKIIGAVNATLLQKSCSTSLCNPVIASPQLLSPKEKVDRWLLIWMKVKISCNNSPG